MKQAWIGSLLFCTAVLAQEQARDQRPAQPARVYFAFEDTPLHKVLLTIGKISGRTVEAAAELRDAPVTFRVKNLPWPDAITAIAGTVGGKVLEENGVIRVVPRRQLVQKQFQPVHMAVTAELLASLSKELTQGVGSIEYFAERNLIVVQDEQEAVDRIATSIRTHDVGPAEIESRLREISAQLEALRTGNKPIDPERLAGLRAATEAVAARLRAMQQKD